MKRRIAMYVVGWREEGKGKERPQGKKAWVWYGMLSTSLKHQRRRDANDIAPAIP